MDLLVHGRDLGPDHIVGNALEPSCVLGEHDGRVGGETQRGDGLVAPAGNRDQSHPGLGSQVGGVDQHRQPAAEAVLDAPSTSANTCRSWVSLL